MMLGSDCANHDMPQVRRKPLHMSSHPDVDGELHDEDGLHPSEAAIDSVTPEEMGEQRKPIVSINGEDVDDEEMNRRRAA